MVISQNLSFFKKFAEADISEIFGISANSLFLVSGAIFDFCSIFENRAKDQRKRFRGVGISPPSELYTQWVYKFLACDLLRRLSSPQSNRSVTRSCFLQLVRGGPCLPARTSSHWQLIFLCLR